MFNSSSSIGTTAHCGLWPVEQCPSVFSYLPPTLSNSHSQHLKISFYFLFPPFPESSPSSRPFQFLSEHIFGHWLFKYLCLITPQLKTVCLTRFRSRLYQGADKSLAWPRRKKSSEACQRRAQFQQNLDASCHQISFPARQGAELNASHSDRNISLFPFWSG